MIDGSSPGGDGDFEDFFVGLTQGTVLRLPPDSPALSVLPNCFAEGEFVIVSQTCDVVLPKRPSLHVAPLVAVDPSEARPENPRYLALPHLDGRRVDLAWIAPVVKQLVTPAEVISTISGRDAERDFALGVARWFGRYPFSDEVAEWLKPLLSVIRKKYDKEQSPLGRMMQHVAELRVMLSDWGGAPADMTLYVIAKSGSIPELDEAYTEDDALISSLFDSEGALRPLSEVAAVLDTAMTSNRSAAASCWEYFAQALANQCKLTGDFAADPRFADAISSVVPELDSEDTFPLLKMRDSELLDLEYLSSSGRA